LAGRLLSLMLNLSNTAEFMPLALAEPLFAPEAIDRIRAETLAALTRQAKNPRSLSGRLWMRDAFEDHPYGKNADGSQTSVAAITRADLADFAATRFRRHGLIVGVVGDVTAA